MEKNDKKSLLKQAKRAVFWGFVLNRPIPEEYHCMMVNLECCSKRWLKLYFRDYSLSISAQTLLIDKYAESNPELIAAYIREHILTISDEMQIKLIKSRNLLLLQKVFAINRSYLHQFNLCEKAQITLINLNDARYFAEVIKLLPKLDKDAVTALIEQQNVEMFEKYLQFVRLNNLDFWNLHQKMVYEQNNSAMISCFMQHMHFDTNIVCNIIEQENTALFAKLIDKQKLTSGVELFLAKSGSKKMIAQYIKQWALMPEAQIELVKKEHKDLLKLHFLKHSISQQALLYVLSFSHFKEYLGIKP